MGRSRYISFLNQLALCGNSETNKKVTRLKQFYQAFYKLCPEACFNEYKTSLEGHLIFAVSHLNRRNSLFSKQTREGCVWIPLAYAANEFQISKKRLLTEAEDNRIKMKVEEKGNRKYTLLYRPDIEIRLYSILSEITLLDAAAMLGTTKKRMLELCRRNIIKSAKPPEKHKSSAWRICADEIYTIFRTLSSNATARIMHPISFPKALIKYGNSTDKLFIKLYAKVLGEK